MCDESSEKGKNACICCEWQYFIIISIHINRMMCVFYTSHAQTFIFSEGPEVPLIHSRLLFIWRIFQVASGICLSWGVGTKCSKYYYFLLRAWNIFFYKKIMVNIFLFYGFSGKTWESEMKIALVLGWNVMEKCWQFRRNLSQTCQ